MKKRVAFQRFVTFFAVAVGIYWGKFLFARSIAAPWEGILDSLGLVMALVGFCIRIVARGYKESGSLSGGKLVTGGLYADVRNPMYLGTFLIGLGATLAVFHPVAVAIFVVGYAAIYIPQILREERILRGHFAKEYRDYCQRTPRLIPVPLRWWGFFRKLLPRSHKAIWRESLSVVLVLGGMIVTQTVVEVRAMGREELWREPLEFVVTIAVFYLLLYFSAKEEK